jgi:hypothetical protein
MGYPAADRAGTIDAALRNTAKAFMLSSIF